MKLKLYGERNTSTGYFSKLIQLNLDVAELLGVAPLVPMTLQKILPGRERVRDIYFARSFRRNLGWKHTRVAAPAALKKTRRVQQGVAFVTLTKNPYAWLLSLHRQPYHRHVVAPADFETFLQTPWPTVGRDNCPPFLDNPVALWNIKNASYLPLLELNGLNLTSEQLLIDPAALIKRIASHFRIPMRSGSFRNYLRSTKDASKDFSYYQDYYLNERWRESLSARAIQLINDHLDHDLASHFGYDIHE
jgi:hypothetical protein